jgi:hypothetical protein
MVAKSEKPYAAGAWYIGLTGMKGNHVIKSLPSLYCFSKTAHMTPMEVYTDRMPFFLVANNLC